MKNSVRLALAALALLAALTPGPKTAEAIPACEDYNGRSCHARPEIVIGCLWMDNGGWGSCSCDPVTRIWEC